MNAPEIVAYLTKEIGLGEFALVRRRLFSRLAAVVVEKGPDVWEVIQQLVLEAKAVHGVPRRNSPSGELGDKGKYFSFSITRRLVEMGYWTRLAGNSVPPGAAKQIVKELAERSAKRVKDGEL